MSTPPKHDLIALEKVDEKCVLCGLPSCFFSCGLVKPVSAYTLFSSRSEWPVDIPTTFDGCALIAIRTDSGSSSLHSRCSWF
jgi:hypothetical protein